MNSLILHNYQLLFHFPHRYLHRLLRELSFFTPLIVLIFLIINLQIPATGLEKSRRLILQNPLSFSSHISLARNFLEINQLDLAQEEFRKSLTLPAPSIADMQTVKSQLVLISIKKTEPEKIRKQIILWQDITSRFPNYRDAYLKLAILNWKIYRQFEAQKNVSMATLIDPNFDLLKKF